VLPKLKVLFLCTGEHWVITLCDHANESCPVFPGEVRRLHVGFDDPARLVADAVTGEQALNVDRRVRDEIRALVETLPGRLTEAPPKVTT
jgi:arsenate reductase